MKKMCVNYLYLIIILILTQLNLTNNAELSRLPNIQYRCKAIGKPISYNTRWRFNRSYR